MILLIFSIKKGLKSSSILSLHFFKYTKKISTKEWKRHPIGSMAPYSKRRKKGLIFKGKNPLGYFGSIMSSV